MYDVCSMFAACTIWECSTVHGVKQLDRSGFQAVCYSGTDVVSSKECS